MRLDSTGRNGRCNQRIPDRVFEFTPPEFPKGKMDRRVVAKPIDTEGGTSGVIDAGACRFARPHQDYLRND
jgi:hypothetical protein